MPINSASGSVLTSSAAAASPLRYRDLRAAYASSCHRPTSSAARATSEVIHLAVSRAFPGGHHDHAVVGPILHVEEAGERRGELGSVRHGCPEEIGRLAMVVTSVAVTQADATGGIGGGATGEYGEPCGHIGELVSRVLIEDHRGDVERGPSRRQAHACLQLGAVHCSQGLGQFLHLETERSPLGGTGAPAAPLRGGADPPAADRGLTSHPAGREQR